MSGYPTGKPIGLLLSGGLDSSILLADLLRHGRAVQPLYVDCGLVWQNAEMACLQRFLAAMASPKLMDLVVLDLPLADLYGRHWSTTGQQVPDSASPDEAVYLPGRNPLLLIKPLLWCRMHGIGQLALAVLQSNPFPDARDEFFRDFESAMARSTDDGSGAADVEIVRPFAQYEKQQVMQLGRGVPLKWTFSCISPVDGLHCGRCNKCAERKAAFDLIDMPDPTEYVAGPIRT